MLIIQTVLKTVNLRGDAVLKRIQRSMLGFTVGAIDLSVPTCADDMVLLASSPTDLQAMLNIVAQDASWERYNFNTKKTKALVIRSKTRTDKHISDCWRMNGAPLETSKEEGHLGVVRTPDGKITATITNNLVKARRTLYALMSSGMHGLNGTHPRISLKLWHAYILPRLVYGLEQTVCKEADLIPLERFHRNTLRRLQHLPERTANSVSLLLMGELPIQATVDKQAITLFSSIVDAPMTTEYQLVCRQLAVKDSSSASWVSHISKLLRQYDLPSPHFLLKNPPGRKSVAWKMEVKNAIKSYWMSRMLADVRHKITARYISEASAQPGKLHPVWRYTPYNGFDIQHACIKAKMISGTYWLGIDNAKRGPEQSKLCALCIQEVEDLQHLLLRCNDYTHLRETYIPHIQEAVDTVCACNAWHCIFFVLVYLHKIIDNTV